MQEKDHVVSGEKDSFCELDCYWAYAITMVVNQHGFSDGCSVVS